MIAPITTKNRVKPTGAIRLMHQATATIPRRAIPTVSFFCGCGGLDLGFRGRVRFKDRTYKKNSFDILAAYDYDQKAVETYRHNIDEIVEVKDLSSFDPACMPSAEVLIGGFPCQDFSTCGPQAGLNSARGRLYRSLLCYMEHHQPHVVVAENVPGLAKLNEGRALNTIKSELESAGYTFNIWTLYAPDYGIPQTRTRLFLVGVRNDLPGAPVLPTPQFSETHRSIKWCIGDLEFVDGFAIPNHDQFFRASKAKRGNGQGDEKSRAEKPAYTVRANAKSRVQFHYSLDRRLTVRECARLQTFPDDFVFPHSATTNVMQIGNAVPPLLAHAVAISVERYIHSL